MQDSDRKCAGSVATSLAHTKCTKHHSLTKNTQKHVSNVSVWSVLNERIWAKTTNVTNMSHKSGGFLSSAIRRHVMCVLIGQWVWKCCGDANVTRCCPLSHVTSVIDAEWFWKQCVGVQGGGKKRGGEKEGKCENKEKINECSECRVLKSVPAFSLLLTQVAGELVLCLCVRGYRIRWPSTQRHDDYRKLTPA